MRADLILKALKLEQTMNFSSMRRSFSPELGERGGSTKEPLKEKFVEAAENQELAKPPLKGPGAGPRAGAAAQTASAQGRISGYDRYPQPRRGPRRPRIYRLPGT